VEPHNLRRQNFFEGDVGKFKSQALAERLARQYRRPIGYSVFPYDRDLLNEATAIGMRVVRGIIIGCVDRASARQSIVDRLDWGDWWLPSLLNEPTKPETPAPDCADAVEEGGQSPIINQAMAVLVLEFVHRFLQGQLTWMGAYLDMEAGTLQTVPAEPEIVARMLGVKVNTLIKSKSEERR